MINWSGINAAQNLESKNKKLFLDRRFYAALIPLQYKEPQLDIYIPEIKMFYEEDPWVWTGCTTFIVQCFLFMVFFRLLYFQSSTLKILSNLQSIFKVQSTCWIRHFHHPLSLLKGTHINNPWLIKVSHEKWLQIILDDVINFIFRISYQVLDRVGHRSCVFIVVLALKICRSPLYVHMCKYKFGKPHKTWGKLKNLANQHQNSSLHTIANFISKEFESMTNFSFRLEPASIYVYIRIWPWEYTVIHSAI